jgi:uncharacterized protein (TIGR03067 family)
MTDLDRLQGTWNVISLEMDGHAMPSPGSACIVIAGSQFQSLGMGAVYEGTVEFNPRKRPKHFDLLFTAGPEQGNRAPGIYELSGDDWKLCLAVTGKTRPAGFATSPGSGHALEILHRGAAPATDPDTAGIPVPASTGDPAPELEGEWQMTVCNADGYPLPDSMMKTGRRVARNGETASYFGQQRILHASYTVDRGADPRTIDYTLKNGHQQFGIWKFEGDTLHICFAQPGKPRPADFTPRKGQGHTFTAWKRTAR